ncbi:unnamed protein product [Lampetra fluviatilis]
MEVVPTTPPDSEGLEMCPAELLQPAQDEEVASHDLPPSVESWRDVASQLGQLLASAACLVERMSPAGAQSSDWMAFQHHFEAVYISVGWSSDEALRSMPTALDDDSLAVLNYIPVADWATLPQACEQMAAIFDGPSNARRRFLLQRWVEAEMPLAFRSTLLVLGQAAVLNILALECPLLLARELGIVLSIVEEADLSSLRVAQGIHLSLCPWPAVVACTGEQMESEAITPQDGAL